MTNQNPKVIITLLKPVVPAEKWRSCSACRAFSFGGLRASTRAGRMTNPREGVPYSNHVMTRRKHKDFSPPCRPARGLRVPGRGVTFGGPTPPGAGKCRILVSAETGFTLRPRPRPARPRPARPQPTRPQPTCLHLTQPRPTHPTKGPLPAPPPRSPTGCRGRSSI